MEIAMKKCVYTAAALLAAVSLMPAQAFSKGKEHNHYHYSHGYSHRHFTKNHSPVLFQHVGTFDVMDGNGSGVAEITDVTADGKTLVYTDGENGAISFVDISNPAEPTGLGTVEVGGEPTSLVILDSYVLVGVNTSESYTNPSGQLVVVNKDIPGITATHQLGGQPDSLALAPDHQRAAIVIENERDEDENEGLLPQNPSGTLLIVDLDGTPDAWTITEADLSPVAAAAPGENDLEPEYVDINGNNEAVVSFQENNYLAIVDITTGETINHFSAGEVTLEKVDTEENDLIEFNSAITKRAEPDAVSWIDDDSFATANEGDYEDENGEEGGSRGFTIFNQDGTVEYESGESFEHWLASAGHYNEGRSENKGCEPESVETGVYGNGRQESTLLFVGSERCNAVGVYDVTNGDPKPLQLLPTGIGPEGLKAIPKRNLFVASTEEMDVAEDGIPTMINIYTLNRGRKFRDKAQTAYPMIESAVDDDGVPIPWVALSGLSGTPDKRNTLYGVSDSFLAEGFIYTIDVSETPALISHRLQVTGASESLDLEGIAVGPDGNFWLASEGNGDDTPNLVLKVNEDGIVQDEITLPEELEENARKNGFEGIAVTGEAGEEIIYVALQRAWPKTGDEDGVETKIGRYDVAAGEWTFVFYPLETETDGGWIGLSELTLLPDGTFAVIERDKGWGPTTGPVAGLKALYQVDLASADFRTLDDESGLVTVEKSLLYDVLPKLAKNSIWTAEKLEGLGITASGGVYVVTDNDGVDDATGETVFLKLGRWR